MTFCSTHCSTYVSLTVEPRTRHCGLTSAQETGRITSLTCCSDSAPHLLPPYWSFCIREGISFLHLLSLWLGHAASLHFCPKLAQTFLAPALSQFPSVGRHRLSKGPAERHHHPLGAWYLMCWGGCSGVCWGHAVSPPHCWHTNPLLSSRVSWRLVHIICRKCFSGIFTLGWPLNSPLPAPAEWILVSPCSKPPLIMTSIITSCWKSQAPWLLFPDEAGALTFLQEFQKSLAILEGVHRLYTSRTLKTLSNLLCLMTASVSSFFPCFPGFFPSENRQKTVSCIWLKNLLCYWSIWVLHVYAEDMVITASRNYRTLLMDFYLHRKKWTYSSLLSIVHLLTRVEVFFYRNNWLIHIQIFRFLPIIYCWWNVETQHYWFTVLFLCSPWVLQWYNDNLFHLVNLLMVLKKNEFKAFLYQGIPSNI